MRVTRWTQLDRLDQDRMVANRMDRIHDDRMQDRTHLDRQTAGSDRYTNGISNLIRNVIDALIYRSSATKEEEVVFNESVKKVFKRIDKLIFNQYKLRLGRVAIGSGTIYDTQGNELHNYYDAGKVNVQICMGNYRSNWNFTLLSKHENYYNEPVHLKIYQTCEFDYVFIHRVGKRSDMQEYSIYNDANQLIVSEKNDERRTKRYIKNFKEEYLKTG